MDINRFKEKTLSLIKKLPYWFNAKHYNNTGSTTAKFLNSFGEALQDLDDCINFAFNMCELDTFDNNDYVAKKAIISEKPTIVSVNGTELKPTDNEEAFIKNIPNGKVNYYYDAPRQIFYISNLKDDDALMIDNHIRTGELVEHFIWDANILDEYGLLLNMPRLPEELNKAYKERLIEYSKTVANSSTFGLSSLLGHRTNLYKIVEWTDGGTDIEITEPTIINTNIFVDDKAYSFVNKISDNKIIIYGQKDYKGIPRKIKYYYGFDIYNLNDIDKHDTYNDFYNTNNTPTKDLEVLFDKISKACPIMWGICRWGEKYWLKENNENYIYIKTTFDPDISKLKNK